MSKKALILTGNLVQDHEFIYPYYRVQEDGYKVDVAVRDKKQVNGIIGVKIIPTKDIPELKLASLLEEKGIKVYPRKPKWRMVTHSGITSTDIDFVLDAFKESMDSLV